MRMIDGDKLATEFEKYQMHLTTVGDKISSKVWQDAKFAVYDAPAVDAMPVVHGRWKMYPECGATRCSACDWSIEEAWWSSYCPNCGAKMDEEDSKQDEVD